MVEIKKKDGESPTSHLHRFLKKVRQSGVLKEARKRKFKTRNINKTKRRLSALKREKKKKEFQRNRKLGIF